MAQGHIDSESQFVFCFKLLFSNQSKLCQKVFNVCVQAVATQHNHTLFLCLISVDAKKSKWPFSRRSTVGVLFVCWSVWCVCVTGASDGVCGLFGCTLLQNWSVGLDIVL